MAPGAGTSADQDSQGQLLEFLRSRAPLLILLTAVLGVGLLMWRITAGIIEYEEEDQLAAGIAQVEEGQFLGLSVRDETDDQFMRNAWLRLAMSEGHRAADSVRRHQMEGIRVQGGQHPETGEAAIVVMLKPRAHEIPNPPFVPVAVRRWEPPAGRVYDTETLQEMQRARSPREEDLTELREVWSGGRYAQADSLVRSFQWVLVFAAVGIGFIMAAGAYRGYAWFSTRWDMAADVASSQAALGQVKSAHQAQQARQQMDS